MSELNVNDPATLDAAILDFANVIGSMPPASEVITAAADTAPNESPNFDRNAPANHSGFNREAWNADASQTEPEVKPEVKLEAGPTAPMSDFVFNNTKF